MTKKILLFCDPGIDDTLAIIYTMLDPDLELVGIVTSYGNVTKEQATINAAYLMRLAGRSDIPIIPGVSMPVQQENVIFYPEIHGAEGMGPFSVPEDFTFRTHPFDTIRLIIEKYKDEIIIVDIGRSTALAMAFILFSEQMEYVHSFYIMGGAFFMPGNITALAEANFYGDPASANFVLKHAHHLTLAPLNATQSTLLTQDMVDAIAHHGKDVYSFMLHPIFNYYFTFYKQTNPGIVGAPIHDLLPIMIINNPALATYIYYDVHIVETTKTKGMSYIDYRPTSKTGETRIAMTLDYEAFVKKFLQVMI